MIPAEACDRIGAALAQYTFRVANEDQLQRHVCSALSDMDIGDLSREVRVNPRNRFDILVRFDDISVVLELKVGGAASSVERQAQRYAQIESVDAVCVVTTCSRLARQLERSGRTLAGKPFRAMALRTM